LLKTGVVAFSFGFPADIFSNWLIARIARQKSKEHKSGIFTQPDVIIDRDDIDVDYFECDENSNARPSTISVAREALKWAKRNEIKSIWIVAAAPHLKRCQRDLQKLIKEDDLEISIHVCESIYAFPTKSWFSPESKQIRTRSKIIWTLREKFLRSIPFSFYKLITG